MFILRSANKKYLLVSSTSSFIHRIRRRNNSTSSSHYFKAKQASSGIPMISSVYNYFFGSSHGQQQARQFATNNPHISESQSGEFNPRLVTIFQQLDAIAPRFLLKKGEVEIIQDPKVFYQTLKDKISQARRRVFLSSLYVGKGQKELVQCIDDALSKNPELEVSILTDCLRGTREAPNNPCSASLLVTLEAKYGKRRVDIRMYHTPHLSGLTKSLTPKRINEGWGLQHMKLYGFDDEIILSGANLSQDYFTNRQDRYYLFKHKDLTEYYSKIHHAIASISYQIQHTTKLKQGFKLVWPVTNPTCEPHINQHRFISDTSYLLAPLIKQHQLKSFDEYTTPSVASDFDTIVYPVSQFTPLFPDNEDASTEKPAILRLLAYLDSPKIKWWFTAGYFNMLAQIQDRLISGSASGSVITASPKANSFYKSPGVSYYLPEAYLLFAKRFLEEVKRRSKQHSITVYEWQNGEVNKPGGWTYHAKGLWITVPEEDEPSITVVGSSNYTKRAYSSDLESNAIIITRDAELKSAMKREISHLMQHASELKLSDFQPKLRESGTAAAAAAAAAADSVVVEDVVGKNGNVQGTPPTPPPKYAIDEDRKISYAVHLAVKLLGGKM
ncbi:uncharacterized protein LODBEIA_P58490 [Lodderomyces beijingensis]|uniref:CDP-diacylglycerol--glycerol-3-phosphate 3-phosphatidyltransferase n=1 Tax=Lodderomyces beijingensis TaxID=1775926 RepID=A0ABP0ZX57_9ASCO